MIIIQALRHHFTAKIYNKTVSRTSDIFIIFRTFAKKSFYMATFGTFSGKVIHGSKIGRTIGFPTINISVTQGDISADGVYVVQVKINAEQFFGIMSIGNRPTFDDNGNKTVEIHLLDIYKDCYGVTVEVTPLVFVRTNQKFNSIDELKIQIEKDKTFAIEYLRKEFNS